MGIGKKKSGRQRGLDALRAHVERWARDPEKTLGVTDRAWAKAQRRTSKFGRLRKDLHSLIRLVRASVTRKYDRVPWTSLVSALVAIVYFLNPFDAIPDFVAGIGLLDDATVVAIVLASLRTDIEKFREWEQEGKEGHAAQMTKNAAKDQSFSARQDSVIDLP